MEGLIQILIYIHVFLGGLGLLSGIVIVSTKKGNGLHKKSGRLFTLSMLVSVVISLVIALLPNHKNPFLFLIGIFTVYLVLTGNRALKFKIQKTQLTDKVISGTMLICAIIMIALGLYGFLSSNFNGTLFLVFGSFGFFLTIRDFDFYKNPKKHKMGWLMAHLGKMLGAFYCICNCFYSSGNWLRKHYSLDCTSNSWNTLYYIPD